jgi:hypothetical protein
MATRSIVGKWHGDKKDNFDAYLKEIGVGTIKRTAMKNGKPTLVIENDKDDWKFSFSMGPIKKSMKFTNGIEYDEELPSGDVYKAVCTVESPTKQVTKTKYKKGDLYITRELDDNDRLVIVS